MEQQTKPGQIIILNGAPRSGKSSIVAVIQETFDGPWMNLGVDTLSGVSRHSGIVPGSVCVPEASARSSNRLCRCCSRPCMNRSRLTADWV